MTKLSRMLRQHSPPIRVVALFAAATALAATTGCPWSYPHPVDLWYCDGQVRYRAAVFSSDGERIAADACTDRSTSHVDLLAPDGSLIRRIADASHAVWTPDGTALYVMSTTDGQLERHRRDGSAHERLTNAPGTSIPTEVSPDGAWIAVNRGGDVVLVASDGTRERLVAPGGRGGKWSPDGSWLTYFRLDDREAWIVRADGSGARKIAAGAPVSWTSDGAGLLVSPPRGSSGAPDQVWLVPLDGSAPRCVLERASVDPANENVDGRQLRDPTSSRTAIGTDRTVGSNLAGVTILGADGEVLQDLRRDELYTFGFAPQVSWRRDGRAVLHVEDRAIVLLDLATGLSRRLAPP